MLSVDPKVVAVEDLEVFTEIIVRIETESQISNFDYRRVAQVLSGTIIQRSYEGDQDDAVEKEVGSISGVLSSWRASKNALIFWADAHNQDWYEAFVWFAKKMADDSAMRPLYLDTVKIKPDFRGTGIALKAVTAFLDLVDPDFVWLKPYPLESFRDRSIAKSSKLLRRYWQRLGLDWDPKDEYLYSREWVSPRLFRPTDSDVFCLEFVNELHE